MHDPACAPNLNDWRDLLLESGFFDKVDLVAGEIGPVHLIGSPRVVVATRNLKSWVWVTADVWGRGDRSKEWLKSRNPGTHHPGAIRYGRELAQTLKVDADREAEGVERKKAARAAELALRNGGAK